MSLSSAALSPERLYADAAVAEPLKALIAKVGERSCGEFPVCLANHLPMVLEAMARLAPGPSVSTPMPGSTRAAIPCPSPRPPLPAGCRELALRTWPASA